MAPQTFSIRDFFASLPPAEQQAIRAEFDALYGDRDTPIYLVDSFATEDTLIACNAAYCRFYGFERSEVEGHDQARYNPDRGRPDDPEVLLPRSLFLDHMRRERSRPTVITRLHKSGQPLARPYLIQLVRMGGRDLLLHVMRSEGESQPLIQNLNGLSEFQNLMRYQRDGVALLDIESPVFAIVDCNTSYAAMNGFTREELLDHPAFNLSPHQADEPPEAYDEWLRNGKSAFVDRLRSEGEVYYLGAHTRKDGSIYSASVLQYLVLLEGREYVLTTIRDLTEWGHVQMLESARSDLLQQIATHAPLEASLSHMVKLIEHQIPDARCAVVVRNHDAEQKTGPVHREADLCIAGENLPSGFTALFHGPEAQSEYSQRWEHGILGAAIAQRTMQFIDSASTLARWNDDALIRHVPDAHSCWALPICSINAAAEAPGAILIFLPVPKRPQIGEVNFLHSMVNLATIAIEQHNFVQRLAHQAEHDNLTGLPNRVLFQDRLEQTIVRAERQKSEFAVLFLDLDGFKHVNDTLGHSAGDVLLREVAQRLQNAVRRSDTVARLGGDEFTVILPDIKGSPDVIGVAEKIAAAIKEPMEILDHEIAVTSSIGIAIFPRDGHNAETLQQKADAAMYQAKSSGKNCYFFYRDSLGEALQAKQHLKCQLRRAFEEQEFEVWYQPLVSTHKRRILGFEALLRWKHPELGLMLPASFIPAAEESGIILHIGEWVIRRACENLQRWRTQYDADLRVAVNVSALQFENPRFPHAIETILSESGLPPACLELDLAESIVIRNTSETARPLEKLEALGIRLAIDDFATSYSSLRYLQKLPIDTVKLDRAFVQGIDEQRALRLLAESVIMTARERGLQVLAEGVQTRHEWDTLCELECHAAQGYFLSRPLPVNQIEEFLVAHRVQ
jgi:diguanylate cyclase (GGDEF)-like protein/PAS domain S-box-containing protein